jgi:signal peptidase I
MDDNTPDQDKKIPSPQPTQYQQGYQQGYQQPSAQPTVVTNASQNLNPEADRIVVSEARPKAHKSGFFSMVQLILGAVILATLINNFVFQSYQVFGQSMQETLHEGDRLIISKLSKSISNITGDYVPTRGDIIVFESPISPDIQLIKRVIALPGERVTVKDGIITVYNEENPNGFNPDDAYDELLPDIRTGDIETVVGEDSIFVAGDNRTPGASLDSRNDLGNVSIDNIIGELVLRVFPLNQAEFF